MCAWLREQEGWEVYGLLNSRLATGGSSSVDPIKAKQNGDSVQRLCDVTSYNAAGAGRGRCRTTSQQLENTLSQFFKRGSHGCKCHVVCLKGGTSCKGSSGKSPRDGTTFMNISCDNIFQMQAYHRWLTHSLKKGKANVADPVGVWKSPSKSRVFQVMLVCGLVKTFLIYYTYNQLKASVTWTSLSKCDLVKASLKKETYFTVAHYMSKTQQNFRWNLK